MGLMCLRTIFKKPWNVFARAFLTFHLKRYFIQFHRMFKKLWKGKKMLLTRQRKLGMKNSALKNGLREDMYFRKQIAWMTRFVATQKRSACAQILPLPTTIAGSHAAPEATSTVQPRITTKPFSSIQIMPRPMSNAVLSCSLLGCFLSYSS